MNYTAILNLSQLMLSKPDWIIKFIENYCLPNKIESLLSELTTQTPTIISIDGSKTTLKCGGTRILATIN